jgi:hypothetical protein
MADEKPLPKMTEIPPGCFAVKWHLKTFIADPAAALVPGDRMVLSGLAELRNESVPMDAVVYYFPKPELTAQGIVRYKLHNNVGGQFLQLPCPPWRTAKVIAMLVTPPNPGRTPLRKPRKTVLET